MKYFGELIRALDSTNKTTLKVAALSHYFTIAPDDDKLWTIALLSHRRPPRPVNTTLLRQWATEVAGIPLWLFEDSYHIVGDLAETIALVCPPAVDPSPKKLSTFLIEMIDLKSKEEEEKKRYVQQHWKALPYYERFVFTKLMTGSFRIGVSQRLMTRALAAATSIDEDVLAYRLMGDWTPQSTTFEELVKAEGSADFISKPYPFYLAYALDGTPSELGDPTQWSIEHKWDGIRCQVIIRDDQLFVWSRGEELVTDKYPEFMALLEALPNGTVLDGELLPYVDGQIGTFNHLQTRIGRKKVSKALLKKVPVILKAYDLLETEGRDLRDNSFEERREVLEELFKKVASDDVPLHISETMRFDSWEDIAAERDRSRFVRSEGLMLKRWDSPYGIGRKKGDWWKWKVDPFTIDAVLTYAMRGHGRRSNLFTDYTFGLWKEVEDDEGNTSRELVTFAKAYSGLTDAEFRRVDAWIKKNTIERFGPVRSVTPELVFEIAFEGVSHSKRHKSGIATRFPRILRWRHDKKIEDANTLNDIKKLIDQ